MGAGLAGLTCAIYLQRSGNCVTLLEASDRVGGRVKSDLVGGFQFDHGFQVINPSYSEIRRLNALSGIRFNQIFNNLRIIEGESEIKVGLGHIRKTLGISNLGENLELFNFLTGRPKRLTLGECAKRFNTIYQRAADGNLGYLLYLHQTGKYCSIFINSVSSRRRSICLDGDT